MDKRQTEIPGDVSVRSLYQMNELSLDLMHGVAFEDHRVMRLPVHAEDSQKSFCYSAGKKNTMSEVQEQQSKMLLVERRHLWCRCVRPPGQSPADTRS